MNKHVLLMRGYYFPETAASNQMCKELVERLASNGFKVTLICPVPTRGVSNEERKKYLRNKNEEISANLTIKRYWLPCEKKNIVCRAIRYIMQNIYQTFYGMFHKYDVLFMYSTPPTNGLVGSILKRIKRIEFFYYLHDVFPDSLVQSKITQKGSAIWKIGRKIENTTYKNADYIGVISEGIRKNIVEKGVNPEKIHLVYNWIDTRNIKHVKKKDNCLFDKYSINPNQFIVSYAGNIGEAQSVETLVAAAALLQDYNDIMFVIIGSGSHLDLCVSKASEIKNIRFIPMQSPSLVSEVYSLGDVSTVLCKRGTGLTGMPSKTGSIFASHTLLLAAFDLDSELADILNNFQTGICVEPDNPELLAEKIKEIYHNKSKYDYLINNSSAFLKNNMDVDVCVNKLINILSK